MARSEVPTSQGGYRRGWAGVHAVLAGAGVIAAATWAGTDDHGAHLVGFWWGVACQVQATVFGLLPLPFG